MLYNISTMKERYQLPKEQKDFFFKEIKKIIYNEEYLKLKNYYHHGTISTYTHAIKVTYLAYCFAVKHNIKLDHRELIRAALLHDLYFYDWHKQGKGIHLHGLFHPKRAVKNAQRLFSITKNEKRHMAHHMFPLTLIPPTTKAGWIICLCDKLAARSDYKALKLKKKVIKSLSNR